ncbi:MAG: hypothetical protein LBI44_01935 [Oscillospiraceae bacterium]|nr:hypothetical protein [Oscillospiraceae bacterium]
MVDIYRSIADEPLKWREKYDTTQAKKTKSATGGGSAQKPKKKEWAKQTEAIRRFIELFDKSADMR